MRLVVKFNGLPMADIEDWYLCHLLGLRAVPGVVVAIEAHGRDAAATLKDTWTVPDPDNDPDEEGEE